MQQAKRINDKRKANHPVDNLHDAWRDNVGKTAGQVGFKRVHAKDRENDHAQANQNLFFCEACVVGDGSDDSKPKNQKKGIDNVQQKPFEHLAEQPASSSDFVDFFSLGIGY